MKGIKLLKQLDNYGFLRIKFNETDARKCQEAIRKIIKENEELRLDNEGMKKENVKFLYGKGHICSYCDFNKDTCRSIQLIKEYALKERAIHGMSIQVFDCSVFKRR